MGRDRLDGLFEAGRRDGRAVFLPFMTAGLPDPVASVGMFDALAAAGADGFELGIPYSDPLMDGPVIQKSSDIALAAGTTLDTSLSIMRNVSAAHSLPTLAMTYANPVFRRGVDAFCADLAEAGCDGIIVPDLPVDESTALRSGAARYGLGVVLFVAPTSGEGRIDAVAAADPVFIYAIADLGVTGERQGRGQLLEEVVSRIRRRTPAPVVVGVGIGTPDQARTAARVADGVIVGSALVRTVLGAADPSDAAARLAAAAAPLAEAVHSARR